MMFAFYSHCQVAEQPHPCPWTELWLGPWSLDRVIFYGSSHQSRMRSTCGCFAVLWIFHESIQTTLQPLITQLSFETDFSLSVKAVQPGPGDQSHCDSAFSLLLSYFFSNSWNTIINGNCIKKTSKLYFLLKHNKPAFFSICSSFLPAPYFTPLPNLSVSLWLTVQEVLRGNEENSLQDPVHRGTARNSLDGDTHTHRLHR